MLKIASLVADHVRVTEHKAKLDDVEDVVFKYRTNFGMSVCQYQADAKVVRGSYLNSNFTVVTFEPAIKLSGNHPLGVKGLQEMLDMPNYNTSLIEDHFYTLLATSTDHHVSSDRYKSMIEKITTFDRTFMRSVDSSGLHERGVFVTDNEVSILSSHRINLGNLMMDVAGFVIMETTHQL